MAVDKDQKKRICVTVSRQDYEELARLALESSRTLPGYLRWLLHQHFQHFKHTGKK